MSTFKSKITLDQSDPYERMLSGFMDVLRLEGTVNHDLVIHAISSFIFNYHRISKVDIEEVVNAIVDEVEEHHNHFIDDCDPSRN